MYAKMPQQNDEATKKSGIFMKGAVVLVKNFLAGKGRRTGIHGYMVPSKRNLYDLVIFVLIITDKFAARD